VAMQQYSQAARPILRVRVLILVQWSTQYLIYWCIATAGTGRLIGLPLTSVENVEEIEQRIANATTRRKLVRLLQLALFFLKFCFG